MTTDREKPKIDCISNQTFVTNGANHTAIWDVPTAFDNSGKVIVTCDPSSGTTFPIGHTDVTCEAVDRSKNKAECSFSVNVIAN